MEDNLFQGNVGNTAADINTPGIATPSSGITIRNNTSIDDATFAVMNNTTGTQVLNNTITHPTQRRRAARQSSCSPPITGIVISGNTINGGTGRGIGGLRFTADGRPDDHEQHDQ